MPTKPKKDDQTPPWNLPGAIFWAVLAGAWVLLLAALISHHPADTPGASIGHTYGVANESPANWVGQFGASLSHRIYIMLGAAAWVAMAGLAFFLVSSALGRTVNQVLVRSAGVIIMTLATAALLNVGLPALVAGYHSSPQGPGGLLGLYIADQLVSRFAVPGTMVVLAVLWWIGALLAVDHLILAIPRGIGRLVLRLREVRLPRPNFSIPQLGFLPWARTPAAATASAKPARTRKRDQTWEIDEDAGGLGGHESFNPDEDEHDQAVDEAEEEDDGYEYEYEYYEDDDAEEEEEDEDDEAADAPSTYIAQKQEFDPDALAAKIKKLPVNFAPRMTTADATPREPDLSGYQFPGMDLLEEPEGDFSTEMEQIVRDQALMLESALKEYRIEGGVVGIDSGPVITLFEVRLAPGTKAAQITNISTDLARALKAQNVRVVPNMAGKDTIGIEVPNPKKEKVRLRELMALDEAAQNKMKLPMFLGKDASGNPLIQDLAQMPHMLIAGTTGSGKSVCMNSIIMSFLFTKRPDELKLVLVDPKMVEMSQFKDIPHLMCPVVTEMGKATAILEWAVTKMDERYELLAEAGVRDIGAYNSLGWEELKERMEPASEEEEVRIPKKLPYMVFVIDELADLMMTNKEVEHHIVRIAQKARAVGIHLILATQRPQANVVTGLIKSNLPCRIAMKVASGMDSRIVLDQKGGELLLGHGDMLFLSPRTSELLRAQGTLVDDLEIRRAVKFLKNIAEQHFEPQLVQLRGGELDVDEQTMQDPLFEKAVEVVLDSKRGSVSLLQRRLTIGYGRASRLIEAMHAAGILGDHKNAQSRELTVTLEEWEAMKAHLAANAAAAEADDEQDDEEYEYEDEQADDADEEGDEVEDEDEQWEYEDDEPEPR